MHSCLKIKRQHFYCIILKVNITAQFLLQDCNVEWTFCCKWKFVAERQKETSSALGIIQQWTKVLCQAVTRIKVGFDFFQKIKFCFLGRYGSQFSLSFWIGCTPNQWRWLIKWKQRQYWTTCWQLNCCILLFKFFSVTALILGTSSKNRSRSAK